MEHEFQSLMALTMLVQLAPLVRRVDDRQQLGELLSRCGMAVDDRNFEAIGQLFAPDGGFHGVVNAHAELCIDRAAVRFALRYLDRYVKREGRWMLQVRCLKFRCVLPFDEVANGLDCPMRLRPPHAIGCVRSCEAIDGLRPSPRSSEQPGLANGVRCAFVLRRSTSNKQARLQDGNEGQNCKK